MQTPAENIRGGAMNAADKTHLVYGGKSDEADKFVEPLSVALGVMTMG
jgi:hypothetical protein